jgi:c-di-GMP-binding flagellar brake protein YcgR
VVIQIERRREPRERTYQLVNVSLPGRAGAREQSLGRTLDLSRGGLRVELDRDLPPGTRVQVDLALREALVSAQAEVRCVTPAREGYRLGLEFVGLDDACGQRIDDFLRNRVAERAAG